MGLLCRLFQAGSSCGSLSHGPGLGGPGYKLQQSLLFLSIVYLLLLIPETDSGFPEGYPSPLSAMKFGWGWPFVISNPRSGT